MKARTVYKIVGEADWTAAKARGVFEGAAIDLADGFIHFSTADQLPETARRHFKGRDDLVLLAANVGALGEALKWEAARGGALFPHLYGPLPADAVIRADGLPLDANGEHVFPSLQS